MGPLLALMIGCWMPAPPVPPPLPPAPPAEPAPTDPTAAPPAPAAPSSPAAPAASAPASAGPAAPAPPAADARPSIAFVAEEGGSYPFFTEQRTGGSLAAAVIEALRASLLPMQAVRAVERPGDADWILRVRIIDAGAGQEDVEVHASGYHGRRVGAQMKGHWTLVKRAKQEVATEGNFETGRSGDADGPAAAALGTPGRAVDFLAGDVGATLAPRIADEAAPMAVRSVQGSTVSLGAGRARGITMGSAWSIDGADGDEVALVEVNGLTDTTARTQLVSGDLARITVGARVRRVPER